MTVHVITYDTADPGDTSELARALAAYPAERIRRLSLLAKTEGNSDVNDHSRQYGLLSARVLLGNHGGDSLLDRSSLLFSTGCEGAMTPFGYLFIDVDDDTPVAGKTGLALGCARSRSLTPMEIGTVAHAELVAATVVAAMDDAGVTTADVELVIVKTPVTSLIPATEAQSVKNKRVTSAFSKAVGALGAGLALGEVDRGAIVTEAFDTDHSLYARRAMVFSGSETDQIEVLLLANKVGAPGSLQIRTGTLQDLLDAEGIRRTLREAGCSLGEDGTLHDTARVAAMLIKSGIAEDGSLRGCRTTIRNSHIDMDKHVRATMSGVAGSILGTCRTFISANTVHQAPPGGGLCACIVRA